MTKQKAWSNFYKALKVIKECTKEINSVGHDCGVRDKMKMAHLRAKRYARILVVDYGWVDVHTKKFVSH